MPADGEDPLAKLVAALAGAGPPLDDREIADALWLSQWTASAGELRPGGRPDTPRADRKDPAKFPGGTAPRTGATPPYGIPMPYGLTGLTGPEGPGAPGPPDGTARTPEQPPPGTPAAPPRGNGRRARLPAPAVLPSLPPIQRALRPVQSYRPGGPEAGAEIDETATAELTAVSGVLSLVHRPVRRTAELYLLMDGAPSMAVWAGMLQELRRACEQLGAFRDVTVQYLHPLRGGVGATARPGPGHVPRPATELYDGSGRRIYLLLSDCTGPLWHSGALQELLRHWAAGAPLAVLQPLPRRLWHRTLLPAAVGLLTRRSGRYRPLGFRPLGGAGRAQRHGVPLPGVHIPVLTPTPAALRTWARIVAAEGGLELSGAAITLEERRYGPRETAPVELWPRADRTTARADRTTDRTTATTATTADGTAGTTADGTAGAAEGKPPSAPGAPAAPDPAVLLAEFDETVSPAARQLAVQLSAAPLALPVMQLVQRAMLPDSGPAELAEVLLGGLVVELTDPGGGAAGRSSGPWFEFKPGVRDLLLKRLSAGEAALVLKHCSLYIERTFGRTARNFPAIVGAYLEGTGRRPTSGPGEAPEPFVYVSEQVLQRFEPGLGALSTLPDAPADPVQAATAHLDRYESAGGADDLLEALRLLRTPQAAELPDRDRLYAQALLHAWTQWRDPELLRQAETAALAATAPGTPPALLVRARLTRARLLRTRGEAAAEQHGTDEAREDLREAAHQIDLALDRTEPPPGIALEGALLHTAITRDLHPLTGEAEGRRLLERSVELLGRIVDDWPTGRPVPELRIAHGQMLLALAGTLLPSGTLVPSGEAVPSGTSAPSGEAGPEGPRGTAGPVDPDVRALAARAASALDSGVHEAEAWEAGGARRAARRPPVPLARALLDLADAYRLSGEPFGGRSQGEALERAADAARGSEERQLEAAARSRLAAHRWARYGATGEAEELEVAEAEMRRALSLMQPGDPQRAALLVEHGRMLLEAGPTGSAPVGPTPREERAPSPSAPASTTTSTTSEAVRSLREAVAHTAPSHPSSIERRLLFARALRMRYEQGGMTPDLYEACWMLEQVLRDTGVPAQRALVLLELGDMHSLLAERTLGRDQWEEADDAYRRAAFEADRAEDPLTAARALHGRGRVLEYLAGRARALESYRAAAEKWRGTEEADSAQARATDDRIRRLEGTQ
ncbi:SAV_2336 N-terminal domain-related protein [Streptomyces sp. NPDC050504]|uniref:SAV_2336 N-terminal domain-related protein n=1 Tax=Streptomyces sp. NPDC050504 TaxID=3365618 RepID=UPI00379F1764